MGKVAKQGEYILSQDQFLRKAAFKVSYSRYGKLLTDVLFDFFIYCKMKGEKGSISQQTLCNSSRVQPNMAVLKNETL